MSSPRWNDQQKNFVIVDTNWPPLTVFAPLLTAVGVLVVGYGFLLGFLTRRQLLRLSRTPGPYVSAYQAPSLAGLS